MSEIYSKWFWRKEVDIKREKKHGRQHLKIGISRGRIIVFISFSVGLKIFKEEKVKNHQNSKNKNKKLFS